MASTARSQRRCSPVSRHWRAAHDSQTYSLRSALINPPCHLYPRKADIAFSRDRTAVVPEAICTTLSEAKRKLNVNRAYIGDNVHALHNHGDFMRSSDQCRSNE